LRRECLGLWSGPSELWDRRYDLKNRMWTCAMNLPPFIRAHNEGAILEVYVQPKASKNEFAGLHQDFLKIRLTAPPVEGEANKECAKFLSKTLGVPKSDVVILQGHKSRQKTILVRGMTPQALHEMLQRKSII